jgi:hypothetical protein
MESTPHPEAVTLNWSEWQLAVLNILRRDLVEVLPYINLDEVDWESWLSYFKNGCHPQTAVNLALERGY